MMLGSKLDNLNGEDKRGCLFHFRLGYLAIAKRDLYARVPLSIDGF